MISCLFHYTDKTMDTKMKRLSDLIQYIVAKKKILTPSFRNPLQKP